MEIKSMSDAVKIVIDGYPVGYEFHGNQLHDDVVQIYPKSTYQYVDTILRMARRHRRDSFIVADQNNSLYKRVKSDIEKIQEEVRKKEEARKHEKRSTQGDLFAGHFFLGVVFFFAFGLGTVPALDAGGLPLVLQDFKNAISSSDNANIAFAPIYRAGSKPCLLSRFRAASDDTTALGSLRRYATSPAVNKFIYPIIYRTHPPNQGQNVHISDIMPIILYTCIVFLYKFQKFTDISPLSLDHPLIMFYIVYMSMCRTFRKWRPEAPEAERAFLKPKGDFYENFFWSFNRVLQQRIS